MTLDWNSTTGGVRNCRCQRKATSHLDHLGCSTHRAPVGQSVVEAVEAVVDPRVAATGSTACGFGAPPKPGAANAGTLTAAVGTAISTPVTAIFLTLLRTPDGIVQVIDHSLHRVDLTDIGKVIMRAKGTACFFWRLDVETGTRRRRRRSVCPIAPAGMASPFK